MFQKKNQSNEKASILNQENQTTSEIISQSEINQYNDEESEIQRIINMDSTDNLGFQSEGIIDIDPKPSDDIDIMLTGCNDDEDGSFIQEVTDYTNDQKSDFRPQVSNVQDSKYIQDKKVMSVISETQNSLFDSRASTANINNQGSIVDGSNNYVSKIQENSSINQCESNLVKDSVIISVTEVSKTKNLTDEPKIISVNNQPIISGKNNTGNASNYVFF